MLLLALLVVTILHVAAVAESVALANRGLRLAEQLPALRLRIEAVLSSESAPLMVLDEPLYGSGGSGPGGEATEARFRLSPRATLRALSEAEAVRVTLVGSGGGGGGGGGRRALPPSGEARAGANVLPRLAGVLAR